jgi:hypothetical protein
MTLKREEVDRKNMETKNNDQKSAHRMAIQFPLGGVTYSSDFRFRPVFTPSESSKSRNEDRWRHNV